MSAAV
jgi:hypothetical protein